MLEGIVPNNTSVVDSGNSTTSPLNAAGVFTGRWVDVSDYSALAIAVKTDQEVFINRLYRGGELN